MQLQTKMFLVKRYVGVKFIYNAKLYLIIYSTNFLSENALLTLNAILNKKHVIHWKYNT